tara:strand:+ start:37095 stop:37868 length:774 start_codon:yes stop_codon:yes gene_type:complete
MNKILAPTTIIIALIILSYPRISNSNTSGSVGSKTGSPTDGGSCTQCHYSATGNGATITSNIPEDGYIPGNLYTINVNITQTGINKFGFEITSEENNFGSAKTGMFIVTDNTETKLVNNDKAITHTSGGTSGTNNSKSWSFDWQAPGFASSTGSITFYAGLIAANEDGSNSGDTYHSTTLTVNETSSSTTNNISNNNFNFNSVTKEVVSKNNKKLFIYNIEGKLVLQSHKKRTKLSVLSKGLYIIRSGKETKTVSIY